MATPVRRIEKDFLLKVLYDEKLPILYISDRVEYSLTLEQPVKEEMILCADRSISKLKPKTLMDMLFNYKGQVVNFTAEISSIKDGLIHCNAPEMLYKDLDRNYLRVDAPSDIKIRFTFHGDRYNLSFPKVAEFEDPGAGVQHRSANPHNLSGLIEQIKSWIAKYATGYKIVNFKDRKPDTVEERVVSETGKALYLPSTLGYFPQTDPYPKKRIITEEIFKRYLESTGVNPALLDSACAHFIKAKFEEGVYSDAWVPVLFHEYVIGYIHIWIDKEGKLPFDFSMLDSMYEFSKVLAFSLKENGYFDRGKMPRESFEGRILDISASGLLFAYPHTTLSTTLLVDSELAVSIMTPRRAVTVAAKIVRRFKDRTTGYFGCNFITMAPEDKRFLFEYLYGKPMEEAETTFLTGQV